MEGISYKDTEHFLPLRLGPTARDTLQEFIDIDVTAEDLVQILQRNQAYKDLFSRFVNQKTGPRRSEEGDTKDGKPEPPSPTHRLIGLLGMLGSRNLILSLRIHKVIEGKFPVLEDGSVEIKASDYVRHAMDSEELFQRNGLEYPETAYAAAVYFDWMEKRIAKHPDAKKSLDAYAERIWKRAVRSGLLAYFLSREISAVSPKQAMAAGFLLQGGKLLLALHDPSYVEFDTALEEKNIPPLAALLLERQKFGINQEELGSHSLRYFDVFSSVIPAVRHFREPYCLKGADPVQYKLASLLYLADAMARSWKIPASDKDPVIQEWVHPSLKHLKLSVNTLIGAMKSAMTLR